MNTLTENEASFLQHNTMWGSDMYPISKTNKGRWIWNEFCGVKGTPTVYRTKKEACAAVEAFISILVDKSAGRL